MLTCDIIEMNDYERSFIFENTFSDILVQTNCLTDIALENHVIYMIMCGGGETSIYFHKKKQTNASFLCNHSTILFIHFHQTVTMFCILTFRNFRIFELKFSSKSDLREEIFFVTFIMVRIHLFCQTLTQIVD